jgi:hypothetical protein
MFHNIIIFKNKEKLNDIVDIKVNFYLFTIW